MKGHFKLSDETVMDLFTEMHPLLQQRIELATIQLSKGRSAPPSLKEWIPAYCRCVELTVGDYAEWVVRILLVQKQLALENIYDLVIKHAVGFGDLLMKWEIVVMRYEELCGEVDYQGELRRLEKLTSREKGEWMARWILEADRKIRLQVRVARPSQIRNMASQNDPVKALIRVLIVKNPGIKPEEICGRMDDYNDRNEGKYPPVASWNQSEGRITWAEAFSKKGPSHQQVKTYLSKIKTNIPEGLKYDLDGYLDYLTLGAKPRSR